MFRLVHYEAETVGKQAVGIPVLHKISFLLTISQGSKYEDRLILKINSGSMYMICNLFLLPNTLGRYQDNLKFVKCSWRKVFT